MQQHTLHLQVDRMARECLANQLRTASRVVTRVYEDELRPLGLKPSQMVLMAVIERWGPVRAVELAQMLQTSASTLSRNLERLRDRGWLEEAPARDVRSRPFRLTATGRQKLGEAVQAWERAQARVGQLLGKDGVAAVHRLSGKIRRARARN